MGAAEQRFQVQRAVHPVKPRVMHNHHRHHLRDQDAEHRRPVRDGEPARLQHRKGQEVDEGKDQNRLKRPAKFAPAISDCRLVALNPAMLNPAVDERIQNGQARRRDQIAGKLDLHRPSDAVGNAEPKLRGEEIVHRKLHK